MGRETIFCAFCDLSLCFLCTFPFLLGKAVLPPSKAVSGPASMMAKNSEFWMFRPLLWRPIRSYAGKVLNRGKQYRVLEVSSLIVGSDAELCPRGP